jgi:hypothetical protein
MATTTSARPPTHPRLIPVDQLRRHPEGWTDSDTLFVVLLFVAVAICALVPLALL